MSGQVAVGSVLYSGEISSDWSDVFSIHDGNPAPTVNVSGSDNGHTLSGPCDGTWTTSGWDFDCSLSFDAGPSVDVPLTITDGSSGTFCDTSNEGTCDTYTTGNYTGSPTSEESSSIL